MTREEINKLGLTNAMIEIYLPPPFEAGTRNFKKFGEYNPAVVSQIIKHLKEHTVIGDKLPCLNGLVAQ